jgi:hypothetical protein
MSVNSFHHYVQHKMAQDIFQTNTTELQLAKICAYKNLIDSLEEWIKNSEEIVVK